MILDRESMRNHKHVEKQKVLVILHLTSGECLFGFIHAAQSERISDVLNDTRAFLPFEAVDGEQVQAQPGDFYGGWITSRVSGPFKGAPGTLGW